jgi:hypothetical protein
MDGDVAKTTDAGVQNAAQNRACSGCREGQTRRGTTCSISQPAGTREGEPSRAVVAWAVLRTGLSALEIAPPKSSSSSGKRMALQRGVRDAAPVDNGLARARWPSWHPEPTGAPVMPAGQSLLSLGGPPGDDLGTPGASPSQLPSGRGGWPSTVRNTRSCNIEGRIFSPPTETKDYAGCAEKRQTQEGKQQPLWHSAVMSRCKYVCCTTCA